MKRCLSLFILCAFFVAGHLSAQDTSWSWQGTNAGWSGAGSCTIAPGPDYLTMTITGNQPHIQSPTGLGLNADDYDSFTVTVRNLTTGSPFQLKWFDASNALLGTMNIPVDGEMEAPSSYTVSLAETASWAGSEIAKFRLRGPAGLGEGIVEWYDFTLNAPVPPSPGCTDAIACNYDSAATVDDGSCTYNGANQPTDYLWQGTKAGWTGAGGVSLTAGDDYMTMSVTGSSNTAEMQSPTMLGLDASQFGSFSVRLSNPTSVTGGFQLRWYDDNNALLGNKAIPVGTQMTDFATYTVDLSSEESWSGNIGKLRLRGPFALDVTTEPTDILWESFSMNEILDCDGNCAQDEDADGICDALDPCFVAGCVDEAACNYDETACEDDGSCIYIGASAEMSYLWQGTKAGWIGAGGVTLQQGDEFMTMTVTGNNAVAEMQSPTGLQLDPSAFGMMEVTLQNPTNVVGGFQLRWYDALGNLLGAEPIAVDSNMTEPSTYQVNLLGNNNWAGEVDKLRLRGPFDLDVSSQPNEIHWYSFALTPVVDCLGECTSSIDDCGVCGGDGTSCIVSGCTDFFFLEFDPYATIDDGSCGTLKVEGCIYDAAENFNPVANVDDGSCTFDGASDCAGDFDGDGVIATGDLLSFLAVFGVTCN